MLRNRLTAGVGCAILFEVALGALPGAAFAQQQPQGEQAERRIDTVTITAEKRSEDIQDVPLSVIAQSGDALRESHVTQVQDLRLIDPSVQFRTSTGKTTSAFSVRGVGTSTFAIGIEQSVSTVIDGVALGDPAALSTLADIEHVEILKGPQGMLFGKNASAGVISIATKDPVIGEWGGNLHASYGKNDEQIVDAAINIPISDTMAARVSFARNHLRGWIYNPVHDQYTNSIDDNGMRAKLLARPNDRLKIVLAADFSYDPEFCCTQVTTSTPNPMAPIAISNAMYGVTASPDNLEITYGRMPEGKSRTFGSNLNMDYDLGDGFSLTSITAYRTSYRVSIYDADLAVFDYVDTNGGRSQQRSFSQEFRVTSPKSMSAPGGSFDFVAGLFGFGQDGQSTIGDQDGYVVAPQYGTVTIPTNTLLSTVSGYNKVNSKSYAFFTQMDYGFDEIVKGLSFTFGGRLTRDEIGLIYQRGPAKGAYNNLVASGPIIAGQPLRTVSVNPVNLPLRAGNQYVGYTGPYIGTVNATGTALASVGCIPGTTTPFPAGVNCFPALDQSTTANNFSWRLTAQQQFTSDIMAYITVAKGYKGPGVSGSTAPNFTAAGGAPPYSTNPEAINQIIEPEIPKTAEIGLKSTWLDGTLLFNTNFFYSKYEKYQTQTNVSTPNGFVGRVANADSLNLKGLEMQATWAPIDNLTFNAAATWEKGTYGDLAVPCIFTDSRLIANPTTGAAQQVTTAATGGNGCVLSGVDTSGSIPVPAGQLNAKGNRLTGLPEFQYLVGARYEQPSLIANLTGHASVTWNWQDKVYFNPNGNELESQKAYGLLGGEIGIGSEDDRWRISIYGSNILDQRFASAINIAPTQVLNPAGYYKYTSPQTIAHYGVRLDYTF